MLLRQSNTDLLGVLLALAFQVFIAFSCIVMFSSLRPLNPGIYGSRRSSKPLSTQFWAWINPVLFYKELSSKSLGLDAIMLLRFIVLGFKFFGIISIGSLLLMIIHFYAPIISQGQILETLVKDQTLTNPSLTLFSMTNVPKSSKLFYLHIGLAYLYTLVGIYFLYQTWIEYIGLRKQYFCSPEHYHGLHNQIILFTQLPQDLCSKQMISDYVSHYSLIDPPNDIVLGRDYLELPHLIAKHKETTMELESILCSCKAAT
jgi:hypothetical protein